MIKANVVIDSIIWKKIILQPEKYINNKLKKLVSINGFKKKNNEFSILLSNNKTLKLLNNKYRKKNKSTDVLSFPFSLKNNKNYIGDIIVSYDILKNRSKYTNFFYEFDKIWIHGLLHLYGYDHKKMKDFKLMSKTEQKILKYFDHKFTS